MQGASAEDMGLTSVVALISNIATSNNSIDKTLKSLNFSSSKETIKSSDFNVTKMLVKIKNYSMVQYMRLSQIANSINEIRDSIIAKKDVALNSINIDIGGKIKNFKPVSNFLEKLTDFVNTDQSKFNTVNTFLDTLNVKFALIGKTTKTAGFGLLLFTGALSVLSLVSFIGILKFGMMLGVLGASIAFFIFAVTKSFRGTGSIKTLIILKTLPDIFTSIGKGVIQLSIGLMIFSLVKTGKILTLMGTIAGILAIFAFYSNNQRDNLDKNLSFGSFFRVRRSNSPFVGMLKFSIALSLMVLALNAVKDINFSAVVNLVSIITILIVLMKLNGGGGIRRGTRASAIVSFAMGIGLLVLGLHAIKEVDMDSVFKLLFFVAGLGLALRTFKLAPALTKFAFGFGILVLAMYAIQDLKTETLFKTLLFISGLGLALRLFKGNSGALNMALLSASLLVFTFALSSFLVLNVSVADILTFAGAITALALVVGLMGLGATSAAIGLGSLVLIGLGASLFVAATSFGLISKLNIQFVNILEFALSIGFMAITLALLTPYLLLSLPAALMLLPLSASLFLSANAFAIMSKNDVNFDNILAFAGSISIIALSLAALSIPLLLATPASLLLIPIMVSLLIAAEAFELIGKYKFKRDDFKTFFYGIETLINGIGNFGLISLGKTGIKALLLVPIFASMLLGAEMMKNIQEVKLSESSMGSFNKMVNLTVNEIATTLSENEDVLKRAEPGLDVLSKIFSVGGNIAKTVKNMASLSYDEYVVKDGKLVLKKRHKLTEADFMAAGNSLGLIIQALVDPLNKLGADSNLLTIGNYTFANPFKGDNKSKGLEFVARLGNAYLPLSESIEKISRSGLMGDDSQIDRFAVNISKVVNGYVSALNSAGKIDIRRAERSLRKMVDFNEIFAENNEFGNIDNLSLSFERIVNVFSDEGKWKMIRKNLKTMKDEFVGITKALNSLDMEKALSFERSMKIIAESNRSDVQGLIEKIVELIEALNNKNDQKFVAQSNNPAIINKNTTTNNNLEKIKENNNSGDKLEKTMVDLLSGLDNIANILKDETLDVNVKNSQKKFIN